MGFEPATWALRDAPCIDAGERLILAILAEYANPDGSRSYPAQGTIAQIAICTDRNVRNKLTQLENDGMIVRGDQKHVQHLSPDRRPVVYDLAIPASWWGTRWQRMNEERVRSGEPALTPEQRPDLPTAEERLLALGRKKPAVSSRAKRVGSTQVNEGQLAFEEGQRGSDGRNSVPTASVSAGQSAVDPVGTEFRPESGSAPVGTEFRTGRNQVPTTQSYTQSLTQPERTTVNDSVVDHPGQVDTLLDIPGTVTVTAKAPELDIEEAFEGFWTVWPRRVKKAEALVVFTKIVTGKHKPQHGTKAHPIADPAAVIEGARRFALDVRHTPADKIPHPTSWLNARRWEDEAYADTQARVGAPTQDSRRGGFFASDGDTASWQAELNSQWETAGAAASGTIPNF